MMKFFGKFCFIQSLFLLPMSLRLLSDALDVTGSSQPQQMGVGVWIFFSLVFSLMVLSGWFGLRVIRK
ncbi:MAG: hypothetical protein IT240_10700 [Bacteroidia bacterium]|jgi:hypothetical protein|nr:hypothetical protein [Bacteroidia bacterium]MCC6769503.1 hypothetical protein [Bacteroidia bacterium]